MHNKYKTERSVTSVKKFCSKGYLPYPHFVMGDHGTHIVDGVHFHPVEQLQNPIIQKWNKRNNFLRELLRKKQALSYSP